MTIVLSLELSTARPVDALLTTATVAAQNAARMIVIKPSSLVPTTQTENNGWRCIRTTTPVIANENALQKTAHLQNKKKVEANSTRREQTDTAL